MNRKKNTGVFNTKTLALGFVLIALFVSIQQYSQGPKSFGIDVNTYTHYNNYIIFKNSFTHLINNQDLYNQYPKEYWDYYKYSPTFALFMAPFSLLFVLPGLFLWNLLNVLVLFIGIWKLSLNSNLKIYILGFIVIAAITSLQNSQSNIFITGLLILSFVFFEEGKNLWAALLIAITVYIKLFGFLAFALLMFYPKRVQSIVYSFLWLIFLGLLPLLIVSPGHLLLMYKSWLSLLLQDHTVSMGMSAMGVLNSLFHIDIQKNSVVFIGMLLFSSSFLKKKAYKDIQFRYLILSSILIWVVIFNHKAESPTYILAVAGIAVWFFTQKTNSINLVLLIFTFIFTELSSTDIFPLFIKKEIFMPYTIKALPCVLIWSKITYDILFYKKLEDVKPSTVV